MATKFTPLTLALIDEGRFAAQIEADLRKLQIAMVEYALKHKDLALKSKGKLTVEINVQCDAPADRAFSIRALTKTTIPNSPASFSVAMGESGDDEQPALFVRNTGSSQAPPQQGILATQDGRAVVDGRVVSTQTGEDMGPVPGDPMKFPRKS